MVTQNTDHTSEFRHIFKNKNVCKCYCGHDCSTCVTYIATQADDDTLRERSQRFYKDEFSLDIPLDKFNCLGGRSDEVFPPCQECPFRKCCMERNYFSCNQCPEYPCKELKDYQLNYVNKCNQLEEQS